MLVGIGLDEARIDRKALTTDEAGSDNGITRTEKGILISFRRTKTDQESRGRNVAIPRVDGLICPVAALEVWLEVSEITDGALFRRVGKSGKVLPQGISTNAVATIVKAHAAQIGLDPRHFSGHSLRAGFVTSAAEMGVPLWCIKLQTGHASDSVLGRYIREADPFTGIASIWATNHVA